MRITPGMISSQYSRNLNASLGQMNYFNNRATTLRKFSSVDEDPVGASKAYGLRRSYSENLNYISNVEDTANLFDTSHATMLQVGGILQEISGTDIMQAINGTMSQVDRQIVTTKIKKLQEAMLSQMNSKYGDKFMFNGGDTSSPPFTIGTDGALLYRGINVDTGQHVGNSAASGKASVDGAVIDFGVDNTDLMNGYRIEFINGTIGTDNAFDATNKVISIATGIPTPPATGVPMGEADIQTQLDAILAANAAQLPAGFDPTLVTVTGDAASGVASSSVRGGTIATNKSAETTVGGSMIRFGQANGDLLNGYTINVVEAPLAPGKQAVDNDQKVINIALAPGSTRADLQTALQGLATQPGDPNGLPVGTDPSKIVVLGGATAAVNFGTGEIGGGEKSIAAGTVFDLNALANETRHVDLGLGLNFDSKGKLNTQSVFDVSMTGLSFLGFGMDADGEPNNIYSLLNKITADLDSPDFDLVATEPIIGKFNVQRDNLLYRTTRMDAQANFMKFTKERLDESKINLNEKMVSVEMVEPAEAIMDFKMQEYAYMAALQMGTKIIQPTFLDFMR